MKILKKIYDLFKDTQSKIDRVGVIESELKELEITKDLLIEQRNDINKALGSDEFVCRNDVRFSDEEYIHTMAKLKYTEKSLQDEFDHLIKDKDVSEYFHIEEKEKALNIIKSLYKEGKLDLEQYNKVVEKDSEGRVKYADVIVLNEKGEILLQKRSIWEDNHKGAWVIPGGHVDKGEEFEAAAKRELREESGISVDKLKEENKLFSWNQVGTYKDEKAHIEYYCLTLTNQKDIEIVLDEKETRDYIWVPREEVDEYTMVFNMKDNIMKVMGWNDYPQVKVIRKAIKQGIIPIEKVDSIVKALSELHSDI